MGSGHWRGPIMTQMPSSQKGEQNRAQTAVMATILTRLCVAIDNVEDI